MKLTFKIKNAAAPHHVETRHITGLREMEFFLNCEKAEEAHAAHN